MRQLQQQFFTLGPLARLAQNEKPGMRGGEAQGRGGLGEMTRRKREIIGLGTNRTSRIWSNSHFRRKAFAVSY
jgi:hypothetical protein